MTAANSVVERKSAIRKEYRRFEQEADLLTPRQWDMVLEEPSFRRLLRDGHQAEVTTILLAELEDTQ